MSDLLSQAIAAIKAGDKNTGGRLLAQVLQADPNNETAWQWMAQSVDDTDKRRECLEQVLRINPDNEVAQNALAELDLAPPMQPQDIDTLDPYEFEDLIARLLEKMGLEVEETKRAGDGGIDVVARSAEPITGGLFVVQCKRYSSNVGEPKVRDLYGVVHHLNASKGILITNSDFTRQAREFAEGKPIELVDGNKLRALLTEYGIVLEDKGRVKVSESAWRLCRGLLRIAEKTDAELREIDGVPVGRGTACSAPQFLEYIDSLSDRRTSTLGVFEHLAASTLPEIDDLSNSDVDHQLIMVEHSIDSLLRLLKALANARIENDLESLRQAAIGYYKALLAGHSRFMRELYDKTEEVDGTLVKAGVDTVALHISIDLGEAKEWAGKFSREMKRYWETKR